VNSFKFYSTSVFSLLLIFLTSCDSGSRGGTIHTSDFIAALEASNLSCTLVESNIYPELLDPFPGNNPAGVYEADDFSFAVFDLPLGYSPETDLNKTIIVKQNENLWLSGKGINEAEYLEIFKNLKEPMSLSQLGFFIYPLGVCILIAVFVTAERVYSLRSGLTFPRKVAKALRSGEFPNSKWKKRSSAERIVWVALKEKPSLDSLRSYSRLEIAALERGLFLLEVVVSAAPLLGLLGTVTGLVQVFSQIPAGGGVGDTSIFSEGIAMALLTTIVGLAIAIPSLIAHSYLMRLIDKRASSLDWLTERLIDAVSPSQHD
jgi:biopolymer transport protein ExbB